MNYDIEIENRWKGHSELIKFLAWNRSLGRYYTKLEDYGNLVEDPEIMKCIIASSGLEMCDKFEKYVNDREFMMQVCEMNGYAIRYANEELRKDRELGLIAVRSSYRAFLFLHESLQQDSSIIMEAAEHVNFSLRDNISVGKEQALELLKKHPTMFFKISDEMKQDSQIFELALSNDIQILEFLPDSYKKDRDFVLRCVRNSGKNLKFADTEFFKDSDIVWEALRSEYTNYYSNNDEIDGYLRDIIDTELLKEKHILLEYLKCLFCLDESDFPEILDLLELIKQDRELTCKAFLICPTLFQDNLPSFFDEEFMLETLKCNDKNVRAMSFIPSCFSQNPKIMLEAIHNGFQYRRVCEPLRSNREFILECAKITSIPPDLVTTPLKKDKEIIATLLRKDSYLIPEIDSSLLSDRDVLFGVVAGILDVDILKYCDKQVIHSHDFIEESLRKFRDFEILEYAKSIQPLIMKDHSFFFRLFMNHPNIIGKSNIDHDALEYIVENYPNNNIRSFEVPKRTFMSYCVY